MNEIDKNRIAWNLLSKDHYHYFKKRLSEKYCLLSDTIQNELGDLKSKSLIHLQCNTGADTISLARLGLDKVTGVDLSDQNIIYANKLKTHFNLNHIQFIESDVLKLNQVHHDKYDVVFTSEGVLGWLPDLKQWAKVVANLLEEDGFFYIYDSHPILHVLDPEAMAKGKIILKYDYLNAGADEDDPIGGYASETKYSTNYWWNHALSDIINALIEAGLKIEYLHEFDTLFWNMGGMEEVSEGVYQYPQFKNKFPMSYSLKAIKFKDK